MCDTSLNLPSFLSIYSWRSSKLWCSLSSSLLEIFKVTKRLVNSSIWTVKEIRIIASKFSITHNLTSWGPPSGIRKIVVLKCSPCKKSGVQLQRMPALKCALLSPGWLRVFSIGFIQVIYEVWIVKWFVASSKFGWRRVLEETFDECKICRHCSTRKVTFC